MGQEESRLVGDDVAPQTLRERSLDAVAELIKDGRARRIAVLTGAGISTAAGIPDFRSPHTGLYANLARLDLPYAEAVFDISYFRRHPEPFYLLARELYPGRFAPTVAHAFVALLAAKGLLLQLYTQNIDCLERAAGVPPELVVEAHGSFATQRCIECGQAYPDGLMRDRVREGVVPRCGDADADADAEEVERDAREKEKEKGAADEIGEGRPDRARSCGGLVKPDIVFFGESLPALFRERTPLVPQYADLVLVIGTSLTVHPFAGLPPLARPGVPRVLLNRERAGDLGSRADDVLLLGDCDVSVRRLADALGWRDELEEEWRLVVGEEEAARQIKRGEGGQQGEEEEMEKEVERMAQRVERGLHLDENEDGEHETENKKQKVEMDDDDVVDRDLSKAASHDVENKDGNTADAQHHDDPVKEEVHEPNTAQAQQEEAASVEEAPKVGTGGPGSKQTAEQASSAAGKASL